MATTRIKPEQVKIRDRILPTCSHGECGETRIWDFATCWKHSTEAEQRSVRERLSAALRAGESLAKLILTNADLHGFDFTGADLSGAFLNGCDLTGCRFVDSDLKGTFLANATLVDADLTRANLDGTVFSGTRLFNVVLVAFSVSFGRTPVNLSSESFRPVSRRGRPKINEHKPRFAAAAYRALKAHFSSVGDYDSASWAAYCERLTQRRAAWDARCFGQWLTSWIFGVLSGYGERPVRSVIAGAVIVLAYAAIYYGGDMLITPAGNAVSPLDAVSFSLATFAGASLLNIVPSVGSIGLLVITTEAFAGLFVFGLFIFTLTKRYVAR